MKREHIPMIDAAIVLTMEESRSFMGQRPDGFVYLPSKEALEKFEAHIQKHRSYDSYSTILHRELHAISAEGVDALTADIERDSSKPWMWSDVDYRIKLW